VYTRRNERLGKLARLPKGSLHHTGIETHTDAAALKHRERMRRLAQQVREAHKTASEADMHVDRDRDRDAVQDTEGKIQRQRQRGAGREGEETHMLAALEHTNEARVDTLFFAPTPGAGDVTSSPMVGGAGAGAQR
jgi:tRNA(Ile2) C34 agmatinyltransferase TiaS